MGWTFFEKSEWQRNLHLEDLIANELFRYSALDAHEAPRVVMSCNVPPRVSGSEHRVVGYVLRCPPAYVDLNPELKRTWVPNPDGSIAVAVVALVQDSHSQIGYKDMDETVGPNALIPSESFIAALSALQPEATYARDWRNRCIEAYRAKLDRMAVEGERFQGRGYDGLAGLPMFENTLL